MPACIMHSSDEHARLQPWFRCRIASTASWYVSFCLVADVLASREDEHAIALNACCGSARALHVHPAEFKPIRFRDTIKCCELFSCCHHVVAQLPKCVEQVNSFKGRVQLGQIVEPF